MKFVIGCGVDGYGHSGRGFHGRMRDDNFLIVVRVLWRSVDGYGYSPLSTRITYVILKTTYDNLKLTNLTKRCLKDIRSYPCAERVEMY